MDERIRSYLSAENIPKVRLKIKRRLSRYGHEHRAEDCAQDYFVSLLEGKAARQTIEQFVIDYLRKRVGDSRTPGFDQKRNLELAGTFEPHHHAPADRFDVRSALDDRQIVDRLLRQLGGRKREVAELYYLKDWRLKEIAEEFNFSEARASALLAEATKNLRNKRERAVSYTRAEVEVTKLLAKGLANKEIADKLCVCEKTVKFHLTNIYSKSGVSTRSAFIVRYPLGVTQETTTAPKVDKMSDWQPLKPTELIDDPVSLPAPNQAPKPYQATAQAPMNISASGPTAQEQVTFVVNTFSVDRTMGHLQTMSEQVTKGDYSVDKVMAACQCIGRMNETIQTVMKAAQVLKAGR